MARLRLARTLSTLGPRPAEPTRLPEGRPVLAQDSQGAVLRKAALRTASLGVELRAVQPTVTHRRFMAVKHRGEATNTPPSPAARFVPAPAAR
jgi:hypothetical protein